MSPNRHQAYRSLAMNEIMELALGLSAIWSGAGFFAFPHLLSQAAIGRVLGNHWDSAWSLTYLAGGLLVTIGLVLRKPRAEFPGLVLLTGGTITQAIAIVSVSGLRAIVALPTLLFFGIASAIIAAALWKTQ